MSSTAISKGERSILLNFSEKIAYMKSIFRYFQVIERQASFIQRISQIFLLIIRKKIYKKKEEIVLPFHLLVLFSNFCKVLKSTYKLSSVRHFVIVP